MAFEKTLSYAPAIAECSSGFFFFVVLNYGKRVFRNFFKVLHLYMPMRK